MKIAKNGGVYIEIAGDATSFQKALNDANSYAQNAAKSISKTLNGALGKDEISKVLEDVNKYTQRAALAVRGMNQDLSEYNALFRNLGYTIGLRGKDLDKFAENQKKALNARLVKAYEDNMRGLNRTLGETVSKGSKAAGVLSGLAAGAVGVVSIGGAADFARETIKVSGDIDMLKRSFSAIRGGPAEAQQEMDFLISTSKRLGQSFEGLAEGYRGFLAASQVSTLSLEQVKDIFTAVTETSTVLGLSSDRTRFALLALEQMMSKGVVSMEELRRQLGDHIPGAMAMAARAMNLPIQQFMKMVENGEVLADELLPKLAAEMRRTFGSGLEEALNAPLRNIERLKTALHLGMAEVGDAGLLEAVGDISLRWAGLVEKVSGGAATLVSGIKPVISYMDIAAVAAGTFGLALTKNFIGPIPKVNALLSSLRASLAATFNLYTLGLTGAATAVYFLATWQSESERINQKYAASIAEVNKRLQENLQLSGAAAEMEIRSQTMLKQKLEEAQEDLRIAADNLNDIIDESLRKAELRRIGRDMKIDYGVVTELRGLAAALTEGKISLEQFIQETDRFSGSAGKDLINSIQTSAIAMEAIIVKQEKMRWGLDGTRAAFLQLQHVFDRGLVLRVSGLNELERAFMLAGEIAALGAAGKLALPEIRVKGLDEFLTAADATATAKRAQKQKEMQERIAQGYELLEKDGLSASQIDKIRTGLKNLEADYNSMFNKPKSRSGKSAANERLNLNKQMLNDIKRLTLGEREYQLEQIKEQAVKARGLNIDKEVIAQWQKLQIAELDKTHFSEASQAIQDFERQYLETVKGVSGAAASVRSEMDRFREAAATQFDGIPEKAAEYEAILLRISELEQRRLQEVSRESDDGIARALRKYAEEASDMAAMMEDATTNALKGMEDAFVQFATTGKLSFSDMANSIISDLARIMTRQAITQPLANALSGVVGSLLPTSVGWSSFSSMSNLFDSSSILSSILPSAKGNVFAANSKGISAYSNKIVDTPTVFPFAKGIGLMGEAGAEAIMPLVRTSSGDLGVRAQGSGDGGGGKVNIRIIDQRGGDAPPLQVQQTPNANGGMDITMLIQAEVRKTIRNGGADTAMRYRYGLSARPGGV